MKFAYADPPYLGCCSLYGHVHTPEWGNYCWDSSYPHRQLVDYLEKEFPDGWAMSASSPSLREILYFCPPDVRVAAWVKSFCAFKRGVRPCYAWEPVIYRGGRNKNHPPPEKGGKQTTPKDFHVAPITLKKGLTGAKPESFCRWVLDLLNVQANDTVTDLFPGTGIMGRVATSVCDLHEMSPTGGTSQ